MDFCPTSEMTDVRQFSLVHFFPQKVDGVEWIMYNLHWSLGVIHLVRTQNFPKNQRFLPPDTHTFVCVSRG